MVKNIFVRWKLLAGFLLLSGVAVTASIAAAAPTAQNKSVSTYEDVVGKSVLLRATGSRGETFTYSVVTPPAHGSVSVSDRTAYYIPSANFNGTDTFKYQAYGSINGWSNVADVTVSVNPVNDAPTAASGLTAETEEGQEVQIQLSGTDIDGDTLTCAAGTATSGTFSVDSGTCVGIFTPWEGYVGNGSAMFQVSDGQATSGYENISINVLNVNETPTVQPISKNILEDNSALIVLQGTDVDKDVLTYRVVEGPTNGTVTLNEAAATYVPTAHFNGTDQFSYVANDGREDSTPAVVSLTISAVNDAPTVAAASYSMSKNQRLTIEFTGSDVDGDALTFGLGATPAHGRLETVSEAMVTYIPEEDFVGTDTFEYWASDGTAYPKAQIIITILEPSSSVAAGVGTVAWEYNVGSSVISGAPAFGNDVIYIGSYLDSTLVYALSAAGELIDTLDIGLNVESSPMVLGNNLVMNTVYTGSTVFETITDTLLGGVALHERLGTMSVGLSDIGAFDETRVWGNQSVMYGRDGSPGRNEDGSIVYAADIFRPEDQTGRTPQLTAIDVATGSELHAVDLPGWTYSSPLFLPNRSTASMKDGLVVVGSEVPDGNETGGSFQGLGGTGELRAYGVDESGAMSETPAWIIESESGFSRGASAASMEGRTVLFAGTQNGTLYGIDPTDGTSIWQIATGANGFGTITVGNDNRTIYAVLAAATNSTVEHPLYANVLAINGLTGQIQWTHALTNKGAVAVVGDQAVYILGADEVLALNERGEELWSLPLTEEPYYGYANIMPETGLLVFAAGNSLMAVQTESTGPSTVSDWPSYRATPSNSGIPQHASIGE